MAIKHGCAPFGNAKARTVVWTFPDPIPLHREPLYTPRRDLVAKYPTYTDRKAWRLPTLYESIQKNDYSKKFPIILTSGRLVEYEGGGDESRSNKWLAELQQEMFCEINPRDANNHRHPRGRQYLGAQPGRRQGAWSRPWSPSGSRAGVVFMPFHFGGHWQGKDLRSKYPQGCRPLRAGRSVQHVRNLRLSIR